MKQYEGTVYVGVVGGDSDVGTCRDSIHSLYIRPGDRPPQWIRATKGYEARQAHLNNWFGGGKHEFLLLLDHDMIFPVDTLEKLRGHKLPFVSGYYLRRQYKPIAPVWMLAQKNGWPFIPYTADPDPKVLHELGASGWGCMLIHRDVVAATKPLLKGEDEIIEDDMDIWPYDVHKIMGSIKALRELHTTPPIKANLLPALDHHVSVLENEIRPLRVVKDPVGSDIRYPWFARQVGFKLYGDASVRCGHDLHYPLNPDDYSGTANEFKIELEKRVIIDVAKERRRVKEAREALP